jgi:hypothetical protein
VRENLPWATSFVRQWLNSPGAISTVLVAVLGGGFGLYRFRFVPRERRRETLEAMQTAYKRSQRGRGEVLPSLPAFLALGRDAVEGAARHARPDLVAEFKGWTSTSDTGAHQVIASEAKFRSLLWAVNEISRQRERDGWRSSPHTARAGVQLKAADPLVNELNDFAQMVELDLFPQGDVLGQLHRSIAAACKALEPVIWEHNVASGRWGLRVLRLMLRAEHYNDAREIHRSSDLAWRRGDGQVVLVRGALYRSDYGRHVPTERMDTTPAADRAALRASAVRARLTRHYGGARLRKHTRSENDLVGRLRYARQLKWDPLDVASWDMATLEEQLDLHWQTRVLTDPAGIARLVGEIAAESVRRGHEPSSEGIAVVAAASEFAGWRYRINRELVHGWIDCSSLVSQAHWIGAAVGTPFIAETQRTALSAVDVPPEQILPGDVLVRYTSVTSSPDGRHNHVVLFAGWDAKSQPWVLEAAADVGMRARSLKQEDADGGIRRFLPFPTRSFPSGGTALALARAVPKLGRLGARLTSGLESSHRHPGVDIIVGDAMAVVSPLRGKVVRLDPDDGGSGGTIIIIGESGDDAVLLKPVSPCGLVVGADVEVGSILGRVGSRRPVGCNAIPAVATLLRLHWEYWSREPQAFEAERGLDAEDMHRYVKDSRPYNAIYAHKLGVIGQPLTESDIARIAVLPLMSRPVLNVETRWQTATSRDGKQ